MAEVAVAVYTATTAAAVVGIHSVMADAVDAMAGGTDYVVARGTSILEAGNYVGKAGRWRKR